MQNDGCKSLNPNGGARSHDVTNFNSDARSFALNVSTTAQNLRMDGDMLLYPPAYLHGNTPQHAFTSTFNNANTYEVLSLRSVTDIPAEDPEMRT